MKLCVDSVNKIGHAQVPYQQNMVLVIFCHFRHHEYHFIGSELSWSCLHQPYMMILDINSNNHDDSNDNNNNDDGVDGGDNSDREMDKNTTIYSFIKTVKKIFLVKTKVMKIGRFMDRFTAI